MKPKNVRQWLELLGPSYTPGPEQDGDECIRRALERLHTGLQREKHAWSALLAPNFGLGRTVREVKKALSGNVVWPE